MDSLLLWQGFARRLCYEPDDKFLILRAGLADLDSLAVTVYDLQAVRCLSMQIVEASHLSRLHLDKQRRRLWPRIHHSDRGSNRRPPSFCPWISHVHFFSVNTSLPTVNHPPPHAFPLNPPSHSLPGTSSQTLPAFLPFRPPLLSAISLPTPTPNPFSPDRCA